MVSKVALCIVVVLITGCISAPSHNQGRTRRWPLLQYFNYQLGSQPSYINLTSQIIAILNAASQLDTLDYDLILSLLEDYFKGR